jgi:hypothetical protein
VVQHYAVKTIVNIGGQDLQRGPGLQPSTGECMGGALEETEWIRISTINSGVEGYR